MTTNYPSGSAHEYFPFNDIVPDRTLSGKIDQTWQDPLSEDQRVAVEISDAEVSEEKLNRGEAGEISESISKQTFCRVEDVVLGVSTGDVEGSDVGVVAFKDRRGKMRLTNEDGFKSADVMRGFLNRFSSMQDGEQQYLSANDGIDWESGRGKHVLYACDVELVSSVWLVVDPATGKQHLVEYEQVPVTKADGTDTGRTEDKVVGIIHPSGNEKMSPEEALAAGINIHFVNKVPGGCKYHVVKKIEVEQQLTGRAWLAQQPLRFIKRSGQLHFADCDVKGGQEVKYGDVRTTFQWGCGDCDC